MDNLTSLLLNFLQEQPETVATIVTALLAHLGASAYVATTATKVGKAYKIIEAIALAVGKAKESKQTEAKGKEK